MTSWAVGTRLMLTRKDLALVCLPLPKLLPRHSDWWFCSGGVQKARSLSYLVRTCSNRLSKRHCSSYQFPHLQCSFQVTPMSTIFWMALQQQPSSVGPSGRACSRRRGHKYAYPRDCGFLGRIIDALGRLAVFFEAVFPWEISSQCGIVWKEAPKPTVVNHYPNYIQLSSTVPIKGR